MEGTAAPLDGDHRLLLCRRFLCREKFQSAAASVGLISQIIVPTAAAAATAIVVAHGHSSVDESAVGANVDAISVLVVQAAAAAAAAVLVTFAHSHQVESAACVNVDELVIFVVQAAAARVAATVTVHLMFASFWVAFFWGGAGFWTFLWVSTSFPVSGKNKETSVHRKRMKKVPSSRL